MRKLTILIAAVAVLGFTSTALASSVSSSIPAGATLKGCVRWDVTVSPDVASVGYYLNGERLASGVQTAVGSFEYGDQFGSGYFDTRPFPVGFYALSAVAYDVSGVEVGRADEMVKIGTGNKNCTNRLR